MNTQSRIKYLIETLQLKKHPEGGYYSEVYRSQENISTDFGMRNGCTSIYFLLPSNEVSKFHQINSDELWFHHEGSPLIIDLLNENGHEILQLGTVSDSFLPQQLVKRKTIFGARVLNENDYSLVSCVVSPGFDFADFKLFSREELIELYPNESAIIDQLT
ncbi:MAG: cupin domain-containing protein [Ginsengibacter sp.]|jgi:hypothetical protein